ncbi:MAG TPA: hypothetical protein VHR45_21910, partial [Thermoanaerobaculia bacterium]|nr:hypothetical protein [Thermoanaerobaculia bacterium]
NTGTAMFSWLTDQVGAAAAGQPSTKIDLSSYSSTTQANLSTVLVPQYVQDVQILDGWKHPYAYYMNYTNPLARQVMAILSTGRSGSSEGGSALTVTSFDPTDYDRNICWADGFLVRWPQKTN